MDQVQSILKHIAPNLASALKGPFSGVASQFMLGKLDTDTTTEGIPAEQQLAELVNDANNLQLIKNIDEEFSKQMSTLNIDTYSIENTSPHTDAQSSISSQKPQIILSALFLIAYFLMLAAIFVVEVSTRLIWKKVKTH